MHIDLNSDQQQFVSSLIGRGDFAREQDVLLAGLEELQQKQQSLMLQREVFERTIAPALRELDAGLGKEIHLETFIVQQKNA